MANYCDFERSKSVHILKELTQTLHGMYKHLSKFDILPPSLHSNKSILHGYRLDTPKVIPVSSATKGDIIKAALEASLKFSSGDSDPLEYFRSYDAPHPLPSSNSIKMVNKRARGDCKAEAKSVIP